MKNQIKVIKMEKSILIVAVFISSIISCKQDNAASKIKKENVVKAEKRDTDINTKGAPTISFDKTEYDFGTVSEGEVVKTTFVVTNTGKADLVITNAQATCGCTVPTWPKEPVKPGGSADIQVEFNTSGKPNKQSKSVTLYTNTINGREVIKIKGMVTPKSKK